MTTFCEEHRISRKTFYAIRARSRRFVYQAPNACWQLDATEYVLTRGRKCVIFQLIDDHSRYAAASHVAWGERACR
nr:hypothetical protein [Nocardioides ochotonae]